MTDTEKRIEWIENWLGKLVSNYPNAKVTDNNLETMSRSIEETEVPLELLTGSASLLVQERDFFPPVSQIIKMCERIDNTMSPEETAEEEWGWVVGRIQCKSEPSDGHEHETACAAVRAMGGWESLAMGNTSDRPWKRKEFLALFAPMNGRVQTMEKLTPHGRKVLHAAMNGETNMPEITDGME